MAAQTVTELLVAWADGDEAVLDPLMALVYEELHRIARRHIARAVAVVAGHGAGPRSLRPHGRPIGQVGQNRAHFFAVAARMMRRILVDLSPPRQCDRRGRGVWHVSLGEAGEIALERTRDLIALDDALTVLASVDYRKSQVVELRFFGGLSVEETAHILGVSAVTVMRDWTTAKAWLHREIGNRPKARGI